MHGTKVLKCKESIELGRQFISSVRHIFEEVLRARLIISGEMAFFSQIPSQKQFLTLRFV